MSLRRVVAALMTVAVVAMVAGCGGGSQSGSTTTQGNTPQQTPGQASGGFQQKGEKLRIGFSQYTMGAPYFAELAAVIQREGEAKGYEVFVTDAQNDMTKQLADVEDLLAKNIDILIFNPKDPVGAVPAAKAAQQAGVPVIIVDSSIDESAPYVTTIQSNNYENGLLVGEWIANAMKGKEIKMALLSGSPGNPVGMARRDGVFSGIIEWQLRNVGKAGFEIVAQGWGEWGEPLGQSAMEDILVAHSDINLLLCENDSMCLGAMKAIEEAKLTDKILVTAAADGQKEAIKLIMDGKYGVTGQNSPVLVGKKAIEVASRIAAGETDFPKITYTEPRAITKENAAEWYDPNAGF